MKKAILVTFLAMSSAFITAYVPSHPHARSQESKIFGRVFLPLNASGRIFRL